MSVSFIKIPTAYKIVLHMIFQRIFEFEKWNNAHTQHNDYTDKLELEINRDNHMR